MANTLLELKQKAAQLPAAERAELALCLIESLDGPGDPDVEQAWRLEIERRIGQIDRGEVNLVPGDEVFARLRRRPGCEPSRSSASTPTQVQRSDRSAAARSSRGFMRVASNANVSAQITGVVG